MSTIAGSVKTVRELRELLKGIPGDVPMNVQGNPNFPRLSITFTESPRHAQSVEIGIGKWIDEDDE